MPAPILLLPASPLQTFQLATRSHAFTSLARAVPIAPPPLQVCNYGTLTWSGWMLGTVLIFAPMWFNPFSFDIAKVQTNYLAWERWMKGDVDGMTGSNWYTWNRCVARSRAACGWGASCSRNAAAHGVHVARTAGCGARR